ncbi:MAG TPA: TetR/AcrR family transcriptional regulator [Alphaproteobacteria bacterium]|jgi:TetR/AcrR family transcriptional repressor of mexJK operon|nr:TetR/AcrR family transcriptional regulator [Alphaproteobacteria bacterium]
MTPTPAAVATAGAPAGKADRILDAAAQVFVEQGYSAASMDEISRVAGVSKATVYAHFTSKEQLFATVVTTECQRHSQTLMAADLDQRDVRTALTGIGREFLELLTMPRALAFYRMVAIEAMRLGAQDLGRIFYESAAVVAQDRLTDYIRRATERGRLEVADPRRAAIHFYSLVKGDLFMACLFGVVKTPSEDAIRRAVGSAVDMFMHAYGPRASA